MEVNGTQFSANAVLREAGSVNLRHMVALFLLFTAMAHAVYACGPFDERSTLSYRLRWMEYALSASLMLLIVAILSGLRDVYTLEAIFALQAITMAFGRYADRDYEVRARGERGYSLIEHPSLLGCFPFVAAWSIVIDAFYRTARQGDAPDFVFGVVFVLLALDSSFAVVQTYYLWPRTREEKSEGRMDATLRSYDGAMHVLSLAAKLSLAMMVHRGMLVQTASP
ncbi:Hypothetical Protein FCC1311_048392 [Hondaea fermentalgiana]|uniref:Uncharacterized protein n=1 Tax=Hondaea fermentalgiana TaxID=2315210 RepID=A0A2R5GFT6_9STRA|nr:Hypothetical Protein FCC1311_048392 [Hondaea fermentalgiana]|eukprot:GBG28618.1 Hypothetical Protein FCC1311_048392 [Hondaea fermentalgiana]